MQFSSTCPTDQTLSGATTPGQSGPGSDGNEGVLRILQNSSITRTTLSDCLVSHPGPSLCGGGGSYLSAVKQSVYSITPPPAPAQSTGQGVLGFCLMIMNQSIIIWKKSLQGVLRRINKTWAILVISKLEWNKIRYNFCKKHQIILYVWKTSV